jgi:AAA15 family ATPase/GTPase
MLVFFSAENHLSFKDSVEFSGRATREKQHGHRVFHGDETEAKLVQISAIFGANASGKSNFYRALELLRRLVLRNPQSVEDSIDVEHFKLDDGLSEHKPTRFVIEILPARTVYRLTVAVIRTAVVEEKLEEIKGNGAVLLYWRQFPPGAKDTYWEVENLQRRAGSTNDRDFIGFKTRDTLRNQLFLGALRGKNIPVIEEVSSWFSEQLALMLPQTTFRRLEFSLPRKLEMHKFCNETLRTSGTGVDGIHLQEVPWQDFPAPPELKEELKKAVGEEQMTFVVAPGGRRFSVMRHQSELKVYRLLTQHRSASDRLVTFELSEESEGTQRFIDLLPAFYEMVRPGRPKVFVIDELDRSLHTQLAKHLVQSYLRAMHPLARSQLIFTTHDITLLDQNLLRRDEVWFMDKDERGASSLKRLSAFPLRYDRDIQRSYLEGVFGGVPKFSGPAFRGLTRNPFPAKVLEAKKDPALDVLDLFTNAFPANAADQMICALVLDMLDAERKEDIEKGIPSQELLDALILATHPELARGLSAKKPTRKVDALYSLFRSEIEMITRRGLHWHECLIYLETHKKAIVVRRMVLGQPVVQGPEYKGMREFSPSKYMPLALFALSVLQAMKQTKSNRGPSVDRSHAIQSFESLRAAFVPS